MIKFVDSQKKPSETTLNDIPVGTTFRGEVQNDARTVWVSGLFLKTHGPNGTICTKCGLSIQRDVFVLKLGGPYYMWSKCAPVRNYVPVDLIIEVKEAK